MTKQADLIAYVFEGQPHLFSGELMRWMDASPRFTAFVETYRDKIRKKVRVTREPESALDLRSELEMAYNLLNDRRLAVTYEPYASAKRRGPDFAVTYRANLVFNIEVARLRGEGMGLPQGSDLARAEERNRKEERILRILLDKLGQMQPGMANLLVIHTLEELARSIDLDRLMQTVKTRVEGKNPAFYAASRYTSPAAFYKDFLHLSGILLWASAPAGLAAPAEQAAPTEQAATTEATAEAPARLGKAMAKQLWVNKQARPGLDVKVFRLVSLVLQSSPFEIPR